MSSSLTMSRPAARPIPSGPPPNSASSGDGVKVSELSAKGDVVKPPTELSEAVPQKPAAKPSPQQGAPPPAAERRPPMHPVPPSAPRNELSIAQSAFDGYATPDYAGRYTLVKLIGRGAYGAVYVALERLSDGAAPPDARPPPLAPPTDGSSVPAGFRRVAIKHICNAFVSPTDARRIYREIKVMSHFGHPNVLPLHEVVKPRDPAGFSHIYLVSELMETDLHRVIHSRQDLTSDHVSYFLYQMLAGLAHVHRAGVLHRDLKPSNLLVNGDCTLKLCDFGLARESDASLSAAFTEYIVTRYYRAPEVLLSGGRYTSAIDVWSVGCILAELLLRRPLFPGENYLHQLQLITEVLGSPSAEDMDFVRAPAARNFMLRLPQCAPVPFSQLFPHVRGPVLDLLARMLTFNPSKRITVEEALAHPFLARVRAARRSVNEDACPPPARFKLRVSGGSAALKAMPVEALKARFYAELCGQPMTPTPSSVPPKLDFDAPFPSPTLGPSSLLAPGAGAGAGGEGGGGGVAAAGGVTQVADADVPVAADVTAAKGTSRPAPPASVSSLCTTTVPPSRRSSIESTTGSGTGRAITPPGAAASQPKQPHPAAGASGDEAWSGEEWDSLEEDDDDDDDAEDAASKAFYEREAAARQQQQAQLQRAPSAAHSGSSAAADVSSPIPGVPISMQHRASSLTSQLRPAAPPPGVPVQPAAAATGLARSASNGGGAAGRSPAAAHCTSATGKSAPLAAPATSTVAPSVAASTEVTNTISSGSSVAKKAAHEFLQQYRPGPVAVPPQLPSAGAAGIGAGGGHHSWQGSSAPSSARHGGSTGSASDGAGAVALGASLPLRPAAGGTGGASGGIVASTLPPSQRRMSAPGSILKGKVAQPHASAQAPARK